MNVHNLSLDTLSAEAIAAASPFDETSTIRHDIEYRIVSATATPDWIGQSSAPHSATNGQNQFRESELKLPPRGLLAKRPVPVNRPVEAQPKRKILQRWCGRVERIEGDRFRAVVDDETKPSNPPEAVQFDVMDVSANDRSLLAEGAVFYWSIGYRDSVAGQRERFSTLRFARRPHITDTYLNRIRREAAELAALLSDE